jgi:hypothetical protein
MGSRVRPARARWDVLGWAALVAAIVVTASAEYDLARACGFGAWVAAGVPAALDIYAVRALRAGRDVLAVVAAMIAVNAAAHLVTAGLLPVSWPLITAVSAIAPLVLWRVHALRTPVPAVTAVDTTVTAADTADTSRMSEDTGQDTEDTEEDTDPVPEDTADTAPPDAEDSEDTQVTGEVTCPYPEGTAHAVVYALWRELGHWPAQPDIVDALAAAGLPSSSSQAKKVRRQVAAEVPGLPGLRSAS